MIITPIHSQNINEKMLYIEGFISELKDFCRNEVHLTNDQQAKALFETTADVFEGLEKAFSDFQSANDPAWVKDPERAALQ